MKNIKTKLLGLCVITTIISSFSFQTYATNNKDISENNPSLKDEISTISKKFKSPKGSYVENEFIVKFKDSKAKTSSVAEIKEKIEEIIPQLGVTLESAEPLATSLLGKETQLVKYAGNKTLENVLSDAQDKYGNIIDYIEPNYIVQLSNSDKKNAHLSWKPTDPFYNLLWGLKNNEYPSIDINIESAWDITKGSPSIVVATIDSGIHLNHEDLKNNIYKNPKETINGKDDDGNGFIDDVNGWDFVNYTNNPVDENGHGTHVAGTIAAQNNGKGIIGIAPNVKILPLKVFDSSGYGDIHDIVNAIDYASKLKVPIVNHSWNTGENSISLKRALQNSTALHVCSAGNDFIDIDKDPSYPAAFPLTNIISVAAITETGALCNPSSLGWGSNYGATSIDVGAPGAYIYSTYFIDGYAYLGGTSMATPHVTGLAALIKSESPNLSNADIKKTIMNNTTPLSSLKGKTVTGGLINAGKALNSSSLKVGSYEESHPQLSYKGSWSNFKDSRFSGGSQRSSSLKGSTLEFSFNGTGFEWYGYKSNNKGKAKIYLDGKSLGIIDLFSPTATFNTTIFSKYDLANTVHTVKIEILGDKNINSKDTNVNIDKFIIRNSAPTLTTGTHDDNAPGLKYSSGWGIYNDTRFSNGQQMSASQKGSKVEFKFKGTGFEWYGYKSDNKGRAKIYIDGKDMGIADLYSPTASFNTVVFSKYGLTNTDHSVRIEILGDKNKNSKGTNVNIDKFIIRSLAPTLGVGTHEDNAAGLRYSSGWGIFNDIRFSKGQQTSSSIKGSTLEFKFNGTTLEWYGYKSNNKGKSRIYIDGKDLGIVDLYSASPQFNTKVFSKSGLPKGEHTVKILIQGEKNPSSTETNVNVDKFIIK